MKMSNLGSTLFALILSVVLFQNAIGQSALENRIEFNEDQLNHTYVLRGN